MKTSLALAALFFTSVESFVPAFSRQNAFVATTHRNMFSGAGGEEPMDEEELEKVEQAAKAMGMSVEEYKLGMVARKKLADDLNNLRVTAGSDDVKVERDGNNPPVFLEVTITQGGKDKGKDTVAKELVAALKTASDDARKGRSEAQRNMMVYIGDELKKSGKA